MKNILIVGAGGHGKVVADTASFIGGWHNIAFLDDRFPKLRNNLHFPVIDRVENAHRYLEDFPELVVAIGNNHTRINLIKKFLALGFKVPCIIHPMAALSRETEIGQGTVIFAQCAVNAGVQLGLGVIVNTGATIDHDCIVGDGVHLSPGVHLGGEVNIGAFSWLGVGTAVSNSVKIGEDVIVGAGSVIIRDTEDHVTMVGNPGRVIKRHE